MWRKLLVKLSFAGFTVAASLALTELVVRLVAPSYVVLGDSFYAPDPELEFRLAPGFHGRFRGVGEFETTVRVNALGLRGGPPADGKPRVLGVGDSFIFGWGVEEDETFLARAAGAVGAEPLAGGVPGYAVCQSAGMGMRLSESLHPSAVVLSIFTGNDEVDEMRAGKMVVSGGRLLDRPETPSLWRDLRRALYARSHVVRMIRSSPLVPALGHRLLGLPEPGSLRLLRVLLVGYQTPPTDELVAADLKIAGCLARFADYARERALPLLAVVIPASWELDGRGVEAMASALDPKPGPLDAEGPRARLVGLLRAAGMDSLDLREPLAEAAAQGRRLYFRHDRHLTPDGHALVAERIEGWLAAALARSGPDQRSSYQ